MRSEFLVAYFIAIALTFQCINTETFMTEVNLPAGKICGSIITSREGKEIYSYRGLRYAEPPVGENRFKQAIPVRPWKNVFDATKEGPSCPQPGDINQSEDCLRLNVYTTKLPSNDTNIARLSRKPVIVYIHSGSFYKFSGQSYIVGPEYIMDKSVVFVTMHYRLAALGFLSTGDSEAPGNLGLKDQVEALRWIKTNIEYFGGDPNSVSLLGLEAGSWSITLHLVSPMSRGLFHYAVASSGSAINQQSLPNHQLNLAIKQAMLLDCPHSKNVTTREMLHCLRTKNATEIAATLPKFYEWHYDPSFIWMPVVEPNVPGVERFLTDQPSELIKRGEFSHVPIVLGFTVGDSGGVINRIADLVRKDPSIYDDLNRNWANIAPISFLYERNSPRSLRISNKLKNMYFGEEPISDSNIDKLTTLYADAIVNFGVYKLAKLLANYSNAPVYYYSIQYEQSVIQPTYLEMDHYPSAHHNILPYFFWNKNYPIVSLNHEASKYLNRVISMNENFAKTGNPIPLDNSDFENVIWPPTTDINNITCLEIDQQLRLSAEQSRMRMIEWEILFGA